MRKVRNVWKPQTPPVSVSVPGPVPGTAADVSISCCDSISTVPGTDTLVLGVRGLRYNTYSPSAITVTRCPSP